MQQTPPGDAVSEGMLAVRELEITLDGLEAFPSDGLKALLNEAGNLHLVHDLRLVSTERVMVAIARLGSSVPLGAVTGSEKEALVAASRALLRDSERFSAVVGSVATSPLAQERGAPPSVPITLSKNVEQTLVHAASFARERNAEPRGAVGVLDFLAVFPPEGSKAWKQMAQLDVSPAELHNAAVTAMRGGPEVIQEAPEEALNPPKKRQRKSGARAPRKPTVLIDRVTTHADEPALIDQLERGPFASVLARNIREARSSGETNASAFIVHLHGPWGSGKSTVLNFLEQELTKGSNPWLVVHFNAWRDQRRQPPWWSLITCIYAGARAKLDRRTARRLWWRWFKWRVRADFMPWAVSAALVVVCVLLLILGVTSSIGPAVSAIGTTITLVGAGAVAVRSLALGSQRAAQTYAELKADPFQPMTTLFNRLIGGIGRPLAVFIDDLDRCDSTYVVELLEGIQTLMRGAPVTYVVAGDRKWICSSFEQKYSKFSPPIGEPGRPLGYLFLDKIFQVSAAIPQLAAEIRASYWISLLGMSATQPRTHEVRRVADERARADLAHLSTHDELQKAVARAERTKDVIAIQATRAEAALRITSAEADADAEHRLMAYAHLLEPNPRSMKRLINSYGMHQATLFLAGRTAPAGALARWTILELRWPLLADFLAGRPGFADRLRKPLTADDLPIVPDDLRELFGDELIVEVVGPASARDRLSSAAIRQILGAVQGDR